MKVGHGACDLCSSSQDVDHVGRSFADFARADSKGALIDGFLRVGLCQIVVIISKSCKSLSYRLENALHTS